MEGVEAMALAIAEAKKGWGRVSPNPLVGCVILDQNKQLIASAHHRFDNKGPHAEIAALNKVTDKKLLKDATVFVTLEPCAHHSANKKAPCCEVLSEYPIKKVIYGLKDPNPRVSGAGEAFLRNHGIETISVADSNWPEKTFLIEELEDLAEHFLVNMREQRPFIAIKVATTSDGYMADKENPNQWITGDIARHHVHFLRAGFDAILVGKKTFITDNPTLNIRHPEFEDKKLKVIVADTFGSCLEKLRDTRMYNAHDPKNIFWVVDDVKKYEKYKDLGINFINGPLKDSLNEFNRLGVKSIFAEGGSEIYSYFMKNNLVDRVYHFSSPNKFIGKKGLHWLEQFSLQMPLKLKNSKQQSMGQDFLSSSRVDSH